MKLIRKWKDTKYNVENFLYENKDGLKVLHTLNKQSLDTAAGLVINAGSYFEKDLNVPNGTAHFLEHVLFSPNKELKTREEIDAFEFGSKKRARLYINGGTGFRSMSLYGSTHSSREIDLMKRLRQIICFPMELVNKNVSREKKIILAEAQRNLKDEKNSMLQLAHFAFDNTLHNTDYKVIGKNQKTIKSIRSEHLIKYYHSLFTIDNSIFSVQSPNNLTPEFIKYIDNISKTLKANKGTPKIYDENLENGKNLGFFFNTEEQGLSVHLFKFQDQKKKTKDYKRDNLSNMRNGVIQHIAFEQLREKKGYIYHIGSFSNSSFTWQWAITGLSITIDPKNFKKAVVGLNNIIYKESVKFLKTKQGKRWFENYLSGFLFPRTVNYNDEYALDKSQLILEGYELYDFEKSKAAAQKISIEELIKYIEEENKKFSYSYWIDSPVEIDKLKEEVSNIPIFNDYSIEHNIVTY